MLVSPGDRPAGQRQEQHERVGGPWSSFGHESQKESYPTPMSCPPVLSVIVATLNNEAYLAACFDSILRQTFKDLEIVVYDDGSSDRSHEIIRGFHEKHPGTFRVILNTESRGVAYARHQAILAAQGEFLTTLDGDDFFQQGRKLEAELILLKQVFSEEGKDVIPFSDVVLIQGAAPPRVWGDSAGIREGWIGGDIIGRTCFIPRDFIMRRRWYFDAGGYDPQFRLYEDWDLKIRLAFRHEFRFTGEVGAAYRRHGHGLSASSAAEQRDCVLRVFAKNRHLLGFLRRRRARKSLDAFLTTLGDSAAETPQTAVRRMP